MASQPSIINFLDIMWTATCSYLRIGTDLVDTVHDISFARASWSLLYFSRRVSHHLYVPCIYKWGACIYVCISSHKLSHECLSRYNPITMALLYQSKPILLAFTLLNLPHAKTQTIDDILIKAPTAPATYTQCRDYCTLSGIRSAKCISNPSFYEGDWDILTAADWACLCDNEHYTFYSVIVGRSCGVWPVCGPVSSRMYLTFLLSIPEGLLMEEWWRNRS